MALSFFHSTSRGLRIAAVWIQVAVQQDPASAAKFEWHALASAKPLRSAEILGARSAGSPSNLLDWNHELCWTSKFPCSWRDS